MRNLVFFLSSSSSLPSLPRLFSPPNPLQSIHSWSLRFRCDGLRPSSLRPRLPIALFSLRPTSPARKQRFSDEEEEDDDEDGEYVAAGEYGCGDLASEDVSEDVVEDEESEVEEGEVARRPEVRSSSRYEEHMWQRVERLIAEVRQFGEDIIDFEELASVYNFPIDKFQRLAIQAFLRGSSVVVSAPTSSGKTLIAEASAIATIARKKRLFYTTPLKALSNQKYRDFRKIFGGSKVGLLTGDSAINKDAPILIMTTEILRNMMYQSVGMVSSGSKLFDVDVVVLDEVHYLSDISRGTVWEEIVIYCPKKVQLICLSATVANPDELAGWIGQDAATGKAIGLGTQHNGLYYLTQAQNPSFAYAINPWYNRARDIQQKASSAKMELLIKKFSVTTS